MDYFCFLETNGRHVGILLRPKVSIVTYVSSSACQLSLCIGLPNFIEMEPHMAEVWRYIDFWKWRPNLLPAAVEVTVQSLVGYRNLLAYQILSRYLVHRWFLKTNGQPNGILFPVSILTHHSQSLVILQWHTKFDPNVTIHGGYMISYRFFNMAAISHIGFDLVMVVHPQCAITGVSFVLRVLAWNYLFMPILRVSGAHFPQMTSPIVLTYRRIVSAWKHVVSAIKRENQSSDSTWAKDQK